MIKPAFILVDGSSYLYRAFHALPNLTTTQGLSTGAIYGVLNMLHRLRSDYPEALIIVVFDAPGEHFRTQLYPAYKANRSVMPASLIEQIAPLHAFIRALGFPLIHEPNVEADDVIGTLATQALEQGHQVLISSSDKDFTQLVSPQITLVNTMTNTYLDTVGVQKKFGLHPTQMIDYLTLVGDTSDNIPGVPLVGPKTATKWLLQYNSLKTLVKHAHDIPGKVGESFRKTLPQLALIQQLVTIECHLPLPFHITTLSMHTLDTTALTHLYQQLEFNHSKKWPHFTAPSALTEQKSSSPPILGYAPPAEAELAVHYTLICTAEQLQACMTQITPLSWLAFDLTTINRHDPWGEVVSGTVILPDKRIAYIPISREENVRALPLSMVLSALQPLLENAQQQKIVFDLKRVLKILFIHNLTVHGPCFDPMLEAYVLNSSRDHYEIKSLQSDYLKLNCNVVPSLVPPPPPSGVSSSSLAEAICSLQAVLQLHRTLWPQLQNTAQLQAIFTDIEMRVLPVLARIEKHGVLLDTTYFATLDKTFKSRQQELHRHIMAVSQHPFNLNSPKQLQKILFEDLQLPILAKTATGQPSTSDQVLQELAEHFELPKWIIEHRFLSKLISTYTGPLMHSVHPRTGRIHTTYHQTGTTTGRLSSSHPNLQNIPIRTEEGRHIRQAFIAAPGHQLISADYSQIELRLMALFSQDNNLLAAFSHNADIHQVTAAELWGIPCEQVTSDMRRHAKTINFGLLYGMSAFGLARQLGMTRNEAEIYIKRYFARYPQVEAYLEQARMQAQHLGYVETLWGRRLYLPDLHSKNLNKKKAAERTAINAPLQGSAADIIKMAMIKIDHDITEQQMPAHMIMQIHDELVFEVADAAVQTFARYIGHTMTTIGSLPISLGVAVGIGHNWYEASQNAILYD